MIFYTNSSIRSPVSSTAILSWVECCDILLRRALRYFLASSAAILSWVECCDTLLRRALRYSLVSSAAIFSNVERCDTLLRRVMQYSLESSVAILSWVEWCNTLLRRALRNFSVSSKRHDHILYNLLGTLCFTRCHEYENILCFDQSNIIYIIIKSKSVETNIVWQDIYFIPTGTIGSIFFVSIKLDVMQMTLLLSTQEKGILEINIIYVWCICEFLYVYIN